MTSTIESVFLRALDDSDLDRMHRWHNDPSLYETLVGTFRFVSRAAESEWLRQRANYTAQEVNLAICVRETGEHVGGICLRKIDWVARNASLNVFIGEKTHRGKGYGGSSIRQLLRHAFLDLGLNRIYLQVLASNTTAIHLYENCGFAREGLLRNHAFKDGILCDVVIMAICATEFRKTMPQS